MRAYVDFQYYQEVFSGTFIQEEMFPEMAREASAFIREITHNRIDYGNITDDVRDAVCAVCEVLQAEKERMVSSTDGREVKTVNTDGESVTYVVEGKDGQMREDVMRRKKYLAARPYLLHTDLLFLGVHE